MNSRLDALRSTGQGSERDQYESLAGMVSLRVNEVRQVFNETKARQRASGNSGVLAYLSQSGTTWDVTGSTSGSTAVQITMTFTGDASQRYPIVNPYADLFINTATEPNRLSKAKWYWASGGTTVVMQDFCKLDKTDLENPYVTEWIVNFSTTGAISFFFKAYASGTSPGTITAVRTF